MKRFLKWTVMLSAMAVGSAMIWSAVEEGRRRVRDALDRAEHVADDTRRALEHTEAAIRQMRDAV